MLLLLSHDVILLLLFIDCTVATATLVAKEPRLCGATLERYTSAKVSILTVVINSYYLIVINYSLVSVIIVWAY